MGIDIPVQWYADDSGQMTLDRFAALPADQLATTRQILLWLFAKNTVAAQRAAGHVVCRGAALDAAGPLFVDHLTIYYRPLGSDAPGHSAPLATATSPARAICTTGKAC